MRSIEGLENYFEVIGNALPNNITVKENNCTYSISFHPIHPAIAETNYLKGFILT